MEGVGLDRFSSSGWADRFTRVAAPPATTITYYRSIWISDLHLGTPRCKADALHDFLRHHQADNLYLVGDIVDGWVQGPAWFWSPAQTSVVEEIAAWHRRGTHVVFLPGNHDELSAGLVRSLLGPISVAGELIHRTAEGRRMLVIHGHQFDGSLNPNRWFLRMGNQAYRTAMRIDRWYNGEAATRRRRTGPLSSYLKGGVKKAVEYLTDFSDRAVSETAHRHKADGVICGHVHRPEQRLIGSIWYINDGDWVSSCTAVAEDRNGVLALLRWDRAGSPRHAACDSAPEAVLS
jgi:UDP-2,3-diacylglucosamine pyrophosphatase LpxH